MSACEKRPLFGKCVLKRLFLTHQHDIAPNHCKNAQTQLNLFTHNMIEGLQIQLMTEKVTEGDGRKTHSVTSSVTYYKLYNSKIRKGDGSDADFHNIYKIALSISIYVSRHF